MKNILFVASECVPFVKTGGLADVVGSLPKNLDKKKYDTRVILPQYACMKEKYKDDFTIGTQVCLGVLLGCVPDGTCKKDRNEVKLG